MISVKLEKCILIRLMLRAVESLLRTRHKSTKYSKKEDHHSQGDRHSHKKSQADDLCRVLKQLAADLELQRFRQQGWGLLNEFLKVGCRTMFIQCGLVCVSENKVVKNRSIIDVIKLQKEKTEDRARTWTHLSTTMTSFLSAIE